VELESKGIGINNNKSVTITVTKLSKNGNNLLHSKELEHYSATRDG